MAGISEQINPQVFCQNLLQQYQGYSQIRFGKRWSNL